MLVKPPVERWSNRRPNWSNWGQRTWYRRLLSAAAMGVEVRSTLPPREDGLRRV
jgi:hypothetical protein